MKELKEVLQQESVVRGHDVIDVSSFLNVQLDVDLIEAIGKDFAKHFEDLAFDAFITVESSGIAPALIAAKACNKPLVIVKKKYEKLDDRYAQVVCYSYTHQMNYYLTVQKEYVQGRSFILIDDFLAKGSVVRNVESLLNNEDSTLVATGICVAKTYQEGYRTLTNENYDIYCQVKIASLEGGKITFDETL